MEKVKPLRSTPHHNILFSFCSYSYFQTVNCMHCCVTPFSCLSRAVSSVSFGRPFYLVGSDFHDFWLIRVFILDVE